MTTGTTTTARALDARLMHDYPYYNEDIREVNCRIAIDVMGWTPRFVREDSYRQDRVGYLDFWVTRDGAARELDWSPDADLNHTREAEAALPVALQGDYAEEVYALATEAHLVRDTEIGDPNYQYDNYRIDYDALYALITATPAQRAAALVAVLERARAKEVVR